MYKIYQIQRIDGYFSYIMVNSMVIVAKNRKEVRKIAHRYNKTFNNHNIWLDKSKTKIKFLGYSHLRYKTIVLTNENDG